MDIILWRHAEAEDLASSDLARRLTPRGVRQAKRMATWLKSQMGAVSKWRVIASPAVRAQQTAAALEMPVETAASIAPGADPSAIFEAAGWPDNSRNVIIVGHQPTLGMAAGLLINGVDGYVSVKKAAAWWFRCRQRDVETEAVLVAMATPETVGG